MLVDESFFGQGLSAPEYHFDVDDQNDFAHGLSAVSVPRFFHVQTLMRIHVMGGS